MFTTNFSFAVCIEPFLSRWNCFLSNDLFFFILFSLLIILAFCATLYELSSEYRFPLSFENDKKHIHSICLSVSFHHTHTYSFFVVVVVVFVAPDNFSIHIWACDAMWTKTGESTLWKTFYAYTFSLTHTECHIYFVM